MEASSPTQLVIPTRKYNQPVNFSGKARKVCITNYFGIDLKGKNSHIYQYSFECQPPVPQDSKDILKEVIINIRKQVKDKINVTTYSGNMLWGIKEQSIPLNIKSQFTFDSTPYKFDVIIKPTKTLSVEDCLKTENGKKMVNQVFNNKIKQVLRELDMDELSRGKYFDKKEIIVKNVGLNIIRGFKFTLCTLKSGLFLQIDACSRVFRAHNLLQEITNNKNKDIFESLVGATVITTYGKRRTYKINRICKDMTPNSKFYHDKREGQVSFAQYYSEMYGLKVIAHKQPLVEVTLRKEKRMNKEGILEEKDVIGYLIPEFISLTGMSDEQRADYRTMKEIAPFTKLEPSERMKEQDYIKEVFNRSGQFSVDHPKKISAFQLFQPNVRINGNNVVRNNQDGSMIIKDKLKNSIYFKDWVVIYSYGKSAKSDDQDADNFVSIIKKASQAFGVKFDDPGFITCDSNSNSWKHELKADVQKNGRPQIIVLYFNQFEEKFYGEMKRFITCELKIPCQAVRRRTITKAKNPMSASSKIVVQMNQKAGGAAWEIIQQENAYTVKTRTMYGAFAISKGKKGFTLAFTGTVDNSFTKVFNYCKTGYKSKETIPQHDFELMLVNWAKNYVGLNKKGPELIMVYRQGLSNQQIQRQVKGEIEALKNVIKKIGQKTNKQNYNPEIIYNIVNTKINTRIFDLPDEGSQTHSNKFQPRVTNPKSGTCVMDELSVDELYDFHLAAQRVTEGTCTPTHYIVAYHSSKMPQEELAQFTYEQCFNYYNWTGAVKVPAALQCANKLAKLVGESIQTDVTSGEVLNSFYFL